MPDIAMNEHDFEPAPRRVVHAVACLWLSVAISFTLSIANWLGFADWSGGETTRGSDTFMGLLGAGFGAFLAWHTSERRNWARWWVAFLTAFGTLLVVILILAGPQIRAAIPGALWGIIFLQTLLQVSAVLFLFSKEARQWFVPPQ